MDYQNSYGKFIEGGRGFAITTPKTPSAWTNFLYNDNYQSAIDQVLSGTSRFVINYSQTAFTDGKRLFYVRDRKSGKYWQLNSMEPSGEYTCRQHHRRCFCLGSYFCSRFGHYRVLDGYADQQHKRASLSVSFHLHRLPRFQPYGRYLCV